MIFDGITAIGTISVALLALFGQRIRNHFTRPRIHVSVSDKSPHASKMEVSADETLGAKRSVYQLRLGVTNKGQETAKQCTVYCDKVFAERAGGGGFFVLHEFVPQQFYWTSKRQLEDVVSHLPSYVNLVELSEVTESNVAAGGEAAAVERCALKVQVEGTGVRGTFLPVSEPKILVPVILYADNIPRPLKHYVEVTWRGQKLSDLSPGNLQIRLLGEMEGARLVGGPT